MNPNDKLSTNFRKLAFEVHEVYTTAVSECVRIYSSHSKLMNDESDYHKVCQVLMKLDNKFPGNVICISLIETCDKHFIHAHTVT